MAAVKKAARIPDDDPLNTGVLAMGFKRARPTKVKKLPVNRWCAGADRGHRIVTIKPNYRGKYVATVVAPSSSPRHNQHIEIRVKGEEYDDPLSLAFALVLHGDGDAVAGAYRLVYGDKA